MKFRRKRLKVGMISGELPPADRDSQALFRVQLDVSDPIDKIVRDVLYHTPAIDVVSDPLGVFHEAVPFESLLVSGSTRVTDGLKGTLNRFFSALTYRRVDIQVNPTTHDAGVSVLFGDLIEPGWGRPCGAVRVRKGAAFGAGVADDPPIHLGQWWAGHSRSIYALSVDPATAGLPVLHDEFPGKALVIEAGNDRPIAQIRNVLEIRKKRVAEPILGDVDAEIALDHFEQHGVYRGVFPREGLHIEVTPNSAFSRVSAQPHPDCASLEIMGLYVPTPSPRNGVSGVAIHLNADKKLMAHGLQVTECSINLLGAADRNLQFGNRRSEVIRNGRDVIVPVLSYRLKTDDLDDDFNGRRMTLLSSDGISSLGWIALPLTRDPSDAGPYPRVSRISYSRNSWIASADRSVDGSAIWLDWLNTAVQLIVSSADGGTQKIGLADYYLREGVFESCHIENTGAAVYYAEGEERHQELKEKTEFRMGPLRVRWRNPPTATSS